MPIEFWLIAALLVVLVLACLGVLIALLARKPGEAATVQDVQQHLAAAHAALQRELTASASTQSLQVRRELLHLLGTFQQTLNAQTSEATRTQNAQLDAMAQQLAVLNKGMTDTLAQQLGQMGEANARRLAEVRQTLDAQLVALQQGNAAKLDEMRQVVDEKLQATLEARLGESFKQVAERLEQVHRGLGEMQTLAQGVGDLRHLLTNVKTRGLFGEAQLGALLEQALAPEQYAAQVATRPGGREAVDFAVRLPGKGEGDAPVWLPIDAKFPAEDYERLLDAQARADAAGVALYGKALEQRVRAQGKSIAEKYLQPPYTTEFGILFLPSEGLYAEVLRRPGLVEALQREQRITVAGPTTLMAMLNALHMGFRTLALEKRSSEVWQVLGAVKSEFGKFGGVLAKLRSQTQTVLNTIEKAHTRSNVLGKHLRQVESLPTEHAQALLPELVQLDAREASGQGDLLSDVTDVPGMPGFPPDSGR